MEKRKIFTLCLMVGFISANLFVPSVGAAHDDAEKSSHLQLSCRSGNLNASNSGQFEGKQLIMNCSAERPGSFQGHEHSVQRMEESPEWEEYPSYDDLIF